MDLTPLKEFLRDNNELLIIDSFGRTTSLKASEIELENKRGNVLFGFPTNAGWNTSRLNSFEINRANVNLIVTQNFGTKRSSLKIVARISPADLAANIEFARIEMANKYANEIVKADLAQKLERVELNKENSRIATVTLVAANKTRTACFIDLTQKLSAEALLATSLLAMQKLSSRKKARVDQFRIYKFNAMPLQKLIACFEVQNLKVFELKHIEFEPAKSFNLNQLWRQKPGKLLFDSSVARSDFSRNLAKFLEIQHIFSHHGETLKYKGLPFCRIRKIGGEEKVWFGVGNKRKRLTAKNLCEFELLLDELQNKRVNTAKNLQHIYFSEAPEAWLEAKLCENIKTLDQNLVLSPIYNQFRTSRDRIDLLALRTDGRLIIIELKVAPDREMLFQAADYWWKIELQRRKGILARADLFGGKVIADKPAIIYLVTPIFGFHILNKTFARHLQKEIEVHRFELKNNWREEISVIKREGLQRLNPITPGIYGSSRMR
ncbi:MAG: hypothetical protein ACK5NT_04490 [Pyrinomonadaceae bacterium]